ncbi:hypothetical protein ACFQZI_13115 [Mucilaginibacter lutimaris]|uniref:Glycine zipper family protein n=1 Tax=Mucilaginibacter lutimaris TaxID=931629 RepID=A0ABW2ZI29_9SPHI
MKKQNNFILYLILGIAFGIIFHKLALGMIFGMAIGIMLDARAAKQSNQNPNDDNDKQDLNKPE